jgi:hypothetical protein
MCQSPSFPALLPRGQKGEIDTRPGDSGNAQEVKKNLFGITGIFENRENRSIDQN